MSVVYKVDDFSIELFVCLPENYPLQPPTIREGKRARVDPAQWRKWMLQLNVFVANQVCPNLLTVVKETSLDYTSGLLSNGGVLKMYS